MKSVEALQDALKKSQKRLEKMDQSRCKVYLGGSAAP